MNESVNKINSAVVDQKISSSHTEHRPAVGDQDKKDGTDEKTEIKKKDNCVV